jgi:hypothetical protein
MSYAITWEPKGAVKRFFGKVTGSELIQGVVEIQRDVRFDSMRWVINDLLEVTEISCTTADIEQIAAMDIGAALTNKYIKVAVVATNPEIVGLAQHYADTTLNVYPTRIFATHAEAKAWIGSNTDDLPWWR